MHDLVHDFAQYLSLGEVSDNAKFDSNKVRHLCWEEIDNSLLSKAERVRTLIGKEMIYFHFRKRNFSCDMLPCRLRVLDLGSSDLKELPEVVMKMANLRYLNLSHTELLEVPEMICNLYNLQTLNLNACSHLRKLPKGIGRLSNLRHLELKMTRALECMPQSIKGLRSIRTLSKFVVSEGLKIGDLKYLKNLAGALELYGLSYITDEGDAIQADLKIKKDIHFLTLFKADGLKDEQAWIVTPNFLKMQAWIVTPNFLKGMLLKTMKLRRFLKDYNRIQAWKK